MSDPANTSSVDTGDVFEESAVDYSHLPRETGVVIAVKEAYGFIRCADREDKVFFHFSELTNVTKVREVDRGDEVSFAVIQEPDTGRFSAVAVELLPPGTVVFEDVSDAFYNGELS